MTKKEMVFLVMATTFILALVIMHFWGFWASVPVIAVGSIIHSKLSKDEKKQELEELRAENERLKAELAQFKQGKENNVE